MGDDERVVGDPTEVLTRSGGSSYVSLTVDLPAAGVDIEASSGDADVTASPPPRSRLRFVGWAALAVAAIAGVLTGAGVAVASGGEFVTGSALAWAAIVCSGVAVVGGILAVIAGFGRLAGVAAIAIGLLANPFLLTQLLGALQQLGAASAATT
jgi:hypothetical protein